MNTDPTDVTGLVLAGGQGSRMSGVDKGLVDWRGRPLVARVLERLRPQVDRVLISANRNHDRYEALGGAGAVVADATPDRPGPLAGLEAGLAACRTPWLALVPCDSPLLPADLVGSLRAAATAAGAAIAMAAVPEDGHWRRQPVFAVVRADLLADLRLYLADGGRRVAGWYARHETVECRFADAAPFRGANTRAELDALG